MSDGKSMTFSLNPNLDRSALRDAFRRDGYVHIPEVLAKSEAESLHFMLRSRADWRQVLTTSSGYVELDRPTRAALSPAQSQALDDAVYAQARTGFQYRYESIRVPDDPAERRASVDPLAKLAEWLSTGEMRNFLREVVDALDIGFVDAQATAFGPGDFLTGHDDEITGKNRRAAYVLSLTAAWRIEYGGLLLFHEPGGHVARGLVPSFNSLNIFRVPVMHSVSEVTRAAPYRRYSVTGWLRTGQQP